MTSDLKLKPSDVLAKAADLIEPAGCWIQGEWFGGSSVPDRANCWCAEGALCVAQGMDYSTEVADTAAARLLIESLGLPHYGLPEWNDAPERTQAEVVAALRAASTLARSEGC